MLESCQNKEWPQLLLTCCWQSCRTEVWVILTMALSLGSTVFNSSKCMVSIMFIFLGYIPTHRYLLLSGNTIALFWNILSYSDEFIVGTLQECENLFFKTNLQIHNHCRIVVLWTILCIWSSYLRTDDVTFPSLWRDAVDRPLCLRLAWEFDTIQYFWKQAWKYWAIYLEAWSLNTSA